MIVYIGALVRAGRSACDGELLAAHGAHHGPEGEGPIADPDTSRGEQEHITRPRPSRDASGRDRVATKPRC